MQENAGHNNYVKEEYLGDPKKLRIITGTIKTSDIPKKK